MHGGCVTEYDVLKRNSRGGISWVVFLLPSRVPIHKYVQLYEWVLP